MRSKRHSDWQHTAYKLASDAPFVIAARVARLGGTPTADSVAESVRMVAEKQQAMTESYLNWVSDCSRLWFDSYLSGWDAMLTGKPLRNPLTQRRSEAALDRVLKPYQKRVTANAKRLR